MRTLNIRSFLLTKLWILFCNLRPSHCLNLNLMMSHFTIYMYMYLIVVNCWVQLYTVLVEQSTLPQITTCINQQINMLLLSKTNFILIDIFSSFEVQNTQHRLHQKSISLKIVSNLCTLIWISRSHIEILMLSRQVQGV